MAWIESHQTLAKHPKMFRLADTLGIHPAQAIGHLHQFWWWAVDYAKDGDLSRFRDPEIARACDWTGDAAVFVAALREAGWIDPCNTIHGWSQYTGRLLLYREAKQSRDAKRQEALRKCMLNDSPTTRRRLADDSQASPAIPNPTEPNRTQQNPTVIKEEREQEVSDTQCPTPTKNPTTIEAFEQFWAAYPNKACKADAEHAFVEAQGATHIAEMLSTLSWQVKSEKWTQQRGRYIPSPANWLRDQRWLDRPVEKPAEPEEF